MKKLALLVIPLLLFGISFAANGGGPGFRDGMGPTAEAAWGTQDIPWDTDNDGFGDGFEVAMGWNPLVSGGNYGGDDTDQDIISNLAEQQLYGTNPTLWDTDNDGVGDSIEIARRTDPLVANYAYGGTDTDHDRLSDAFETNVLGTDPHFSDTDDDDYTDSCEYSAGTNPLDVNSHPNPPAHPPVGAAVGISGTTINTNTLLILVLLLEFVIIYMLWKKKR